MISYIFCTEKVSGLKHKIGFSLVLWGKYKDFPSLALIYYKVIGPTCVYSDMSGEFVTPRKPPVALIDRTSVGPLVHRSLAGPVWILSGPDWHQIDGNVSSLGVL